MIYKMLPIKNGEQQIYARIDDDGLCRLTCTEDYEPFKEWLAEGNEPLPHDAPVLEQTSDNTFTVQL